MKFMQEGQISWCLYFWPKFEWKDIGLAKLAIADGCAPHSSSEFESLFS